jgi:hypothetical protein
MRANPSILTLLTLFVLKHPGDEALWPSEE